MKHPRTTGDLCDQDIADYVYGRLSPSDPKWVELNEEARQDPDNSRVGRFCAEANRSIEEAMNIPSAYILDAGVGVHRDSGGKGTQPDNEVSDS